MRKWAYLAEPREYNGQQIYKVMVYETEKEGTYAFLYNSLKTQICSIDEWYESAVEATRAWEHYIKDGYWEMIDDPMPNCQTDCILPIRVKGRNIGKPEWGRYEQFVDGNWIEYIE